jgi:hypothetical protein
LFAVVGLTVLILPALSLANEMLGDPLTLSTMTSVVIFPALFAASLYSAGYLSLAQLRDMCHVFILSGLGLSVASAVIVIVLDIPINSPVPRVIVWVAAYGITLWTVSSSNQSG